MGILDGGASRGRCYRSSQLVHYLVVCCFWLLTIWGARKGLGWTPGRRNRRLGAERGGLGRGAGRGRNGRARGRGWAAGGGSCRGFGELHTLRFYPDVRTMLGGRLGFLPNGKTEWNVTEKLARERGVGRGE